MFELLEQNIYHYWPINSRTFYERFEELKNLNDPIGESLVAVLGTETS